MQIFRLSKAKSSNLNELSSYLYSDEKYCKKLFLRVVKKCVSVKCWCVLFQFVFTEAIKSPNRNNFFFFWGGELTYYAFRIKKLPKTKCFLEELIQVLQLGELFN